MYAGCAYGPREIWGFRVKHCVRSAYYPREIFFGISRDPPSATSLLVTSAAAAALDRFAPVSSPVKSCVKSRSRSPAAVLGVEVPCPRFRSSSCLFFCKAVAAVRVRTVVSAAAAAAVACHYSSFTSAVSR